MGELVCCFVMGTKHTLISRATKITKPIEDLVASFQSTNLDVIASAFRKKYMKLNYMLCKSYSSTNLEANKKKKINTSLCSVGKMSHDIRSHSALI